MDFKPQDLLFAAVFAILIIKRDSRLAVITGLLSLIISIPLFATWIFFTAQRMTWYATAFFLLAVVIELIKLAKLKK